MRLLDRVGRSLRAALREIKAGRPGTAAFALLPGSPVFASPQFASLAREGYARNTIVYAGIEALATSVPEARLGVFDVKTGARLPDETVPALAILDAPTPGGIWDRFSLWEQTVVWLYLGGSVRWHKVRAEDGRVAEIWPLRPDRTTAVFDRSGLLQRWEYRSGAEVFPISPRDVTSFRLPASGADDRDEVFGMSPLRPAIEALAADNESVGFLAALLANFAVPGTVVTTPEDVEMDPDKAARYRQVWHERFGQRKRGDVMFLRSGADVKRLSLNLRELTLADLEDGLTSRLLMVLGVPPIIVGTRLGLSRSTFANFAEARQSFTEETVSELWKRLAAGMMADADFNPGPGRELRWDTTGVSALAGVQAAREASAIASYGAGLRTLDEARGLAGLPPVGPERGGDDFKAPPPSPFGLPSPDDVAGDRGARGREPPPRPRRGAEDEGDEDEEESEAEEKSRARIRTRLVEVVPGWLGARRDRKAADLANILRAVGRVRFAQKGAAAIERGARAVFEAQADDVRRALRASGVKSDALTPEQVTAIRNALNALVAGWESKSAEDVGPLLTRLLEASARNAALEFGAAFDLSSDRVRSFVKDYVVRFSAATSANSADRVREVLLDGLDRGWTVKDVRGALEDEFDDWTRRRAALVAQTETIRAASRGTKAGYLAAEVPLYEWLASADACAICLAFAAKGAIAIEEAFVEQGDLFDPVDPESGEKLLVRPFRATYERIEGPPGHPGCVCAIVPAGV